MADPLALTKIRFAAGAYPGGPPLEIDGTRVVVLVGPNNSGKSLALRELENWAAGRESERQVISDAEVQWPSFDDAMDLFEPLKAKPPPTLEKGHIYVSIARLGNQTLEYAVNPEAIRNWLDVKQDQTLRDYLLQPYVLRLDGRGRFALADPQPSGDLQNPPRNHLWRLLQDEEGRIKVRKLVKDAFGLHFFIDVTGIQELRIRMATEPPPTDVDELSFASAVQEFAGGAPMLTELGDGVQAFVGLIAAVIGLSSRLVLIDEPEAFLHPVLSQRLGGNLVELASERAGNLIVATHSSNFLMGCIEQSPDTSVVRLTYEAGIPTARALPAAQLSELMHNPLLRSTGALSGLFHRAVVITESDNDRAFYGEINRRLVRVGRGVADTQFVNAQNWQTIARIMAPLRALGIPAAAIMDLDALASSESWSAFFAAMGLNDAQRTLLGQQRANCAEPLRKAGKKAYKASGISALKKADEEKVKDFLKICQRYGLFVVPVGELERWLPSLEVTGTKTRWAINMLERLGSDPSTPDWVSPQLDDVWSFLDDIASWANDPNRLGIPGSSS